MSQQIKITPEELKHQSEMIRQVSEEYNQVLKNVKTTLNQTNGHWSKTIANSFGTKITSIAKSGSALVGLLDASSKAASSAAESFTSIDQQLQKVIRGDEVNAKNILKEVVSQTKSDLSDIKNALKYLKDLYKKTLSPEERKALEALLKKILGDEKYGVINFTLSLFSDGLTKENFIDLVKTVGKALTKDSLKVSVIVTTLKNFEKYAKLTNKYETAMTEALKAGKYGQTVKLLIEDITKNLFGGVIDVGAQVIANHKFGGVFSINDGVQIIKKFTGFDAGKLFNKFTGAVNSLFSF